MGVLATTLFTPLASLATLFAEYRKGLAACNAPVGAFKNEQISVFTFMHCAATRAQAIASRAAESALWFLNAAPNVFQVPRSLWIDAIRGDPAWSGGDYRDQPLQGLTGAIHVLLWMGSSPLLWQTEAPTRAQAEAKLAQMIDDPLGEFLDVLGCNEYVGWYDGLPDKADRLEWKSKYDKPLIMSEFGGDALYGHHGDSLTRWTEEYQESIYQHQIGMLKRIPFLRGTAPWILMDFRSPRRPLPGIQEYWNRKGLVSNRGEKKKAFYVMQQWYRERQ